MTRDWDLRADELSGEAIAAGQPAAWFERLYAEGAAGAVGMPWDRDTPQPQLVDWWTPRPGFADGRGRRAVVVGCGLGADAEHAASHGFETTGFDVSATAIDQARQRHPGSTVDYRVIDLLDLPADLVGRYDLVVEVFTLQALPDPPRTRAAAAVTSLLAPGGTLVAIAFRDIGAPPPDRPPYPLTRRDLALLETTEVRMVQAEEVAHPARWVATYERRSWLPHPWQPAAVEGCRHYPVPARRRLRRRPAIARRHG
ncbi:class I SAM-dependent methyltransferase [Auraticoccus monumenti]|uniref:Methyltransferase domain-containing protein n=1 Tax=Auraticoccus monumenti TaxID=675864 RepID=A0A1G6YSJ2_9ACTN|nr:class I SAM-dependent methyltransferase [Auraticoccus monumenti]SDD93003.1 Methyltransferase domain-containing protein [Auraticoccus monumenti]